MPATRLKSSPGFAPTEEASVSAEWRAPKRRWHVVVGAFALAASAAMFLISRDTETAAAAASPQPATAEVMKSPAIQEAKADVPPEVVAPAPVPAPVVETAQPQAKPVVHKTRKLPAKPRRDASHDPNGTVDPYL